MYNAARTELVRLLNLHGGTVEFGPGDVQPLTDQRLGQSEAWDLNGCDHMKQDLTGGKTHPTHAIKQLSAASEREPHCFYPSSTA